MFGNTKGWIISGVIAVVLTAMLLTAAQIPSPTPPTGRFPDAFKAVALPEDPAKLLAMPGDCDAADLYRKAIEEYLQNRKPYDEPPKAPDLAKLPALDFLIQATNCGKMSLFSKDPKLAVSYSSEMESMDALDVLGGLARKIGASNLSSNPEVARKLFNADFALGQKMFQERVSWDEFNYGINHMMDSSAGFANLAHKSNDAATVELAHHFSSEVNDYKSSKLVPIVGVTRSLQSDTVGKYGGDLVQMARQSPERMWKVDALLAMGRMKFNSTSRGDQIYAARHLKDWLNDPDPAVKYAAKLADDLTLLEYRKLGN